MNKTLTIMLATTLSFTLAGTAIAGSQRVKAETTPFTDNINVALSGLPNGAASIQYIDNNDVNISGPSTASNGTFTAQISSDNLEEDGQPSMILSYNGAACTMQFNDGPWDYLTFAAGNPPVCDHFTVSPINNSSEAYHLYSFSIAYTG